jgi:hypothetical protein
MCLPAGWLAEAEVAHDCALWQLNGLSSERNVAVRQAVLLEARRLLDVMREAEGHLSAWLPAGRLAPLSHRRQQLGAILREMQAEGLRPRGGCRQPAALLIRCCEQSQGNGAALLHPRPFVLNKSCTMQ